MKLIFVLCAIMLPGMVTVSSALDLQKSITPNQSASGSSFEPEPFIRNSFIRNSFARNSFIQNSFNQNSFIRNSFNQNSFTRNSISRERPATQTLISSDVRHGGFGSLIYGITSLNGNPVYLSGTRGAWILNFSNQHALHLGLASYRTSPDVSVVSWPHDGISRPKINTNYGGFEMEYLNQSYKVVHFGTQLLIGSGNVRYGSNVPGLDKTRDYYFVVQPGVNVLLNITSWFRISGGMYYRYASNVNLDGTSTNNISGLTGIMGLRFGRF